MAANLEQLVLRLHEVEAVKFGNFTLKSGIQSPVYFDLRVIVSYPELMRQVSDQLWNAVNSAGCKYDNVCGVPYTALPLATLIAADHKIPMLIRRKEAKDYGTKKMLEGHYSPNQVCLVVEDVITSGSSVLETATLLENNDLKVKDAVVLLDREQGGRQRLKQQGINMHSICGLSKLLTILHKAGRVDEDMVKRVDQFIEQNSFKPEQPKKEPEELNGAPKKKTRKALTYKERAELCTQPLAKQLFNLMEEKKSNLAFSADVTSSKQLLELTDTVGPYICVLKTHIDILEDYNSSVAEKLTELAKKHQFLIFEDRKFADIGNTVQMQYKSGVHHIVDWAHIINAHALPGPGIVTGLKEIGLPKERACLLIAEMTSKGCLANPEYTAGSVKMAEEHSDFVIGFISKSSVTSDPRFIHMTPGVKLAEGGDNLGQQYTTPHQVIAVNLSDIIIVGRGILKSSNPAEAAKQYQEAGFQAYTARIS